jgi:hypothetical protein
MFFIFAGEIPKFMKTVRIYGQRHVHVRPVTQSVVAAGAAAW